MNETKGCMFFNFGSACVVKLLVAMHSLRCYYAGPVVCILFDQPEHSAEFDAALRSLGVQSRLANAFTSLRAGTLRHRVFQSSPFASTLVFDSDLLFRTSPEPLFDQLELTGILTTSMKAYPLGIERYTVEGQNYYRDPASELQPSRLSLLRIFQPMFSPAEYEWAVDALLNKRLDINVGVMGLSGSAGAVFLDDYASRMERCRIDGKNQDELFVLGLCASHPVTIVDDSWNFGSHEAYWTSSIYDAKIVHYFADGWSAGAVRFGRDSQSIAGAMWLNAFQKAGEDISFEPWLTYDPYFV